MAERKKRIARFAFYDRRRIEKELEAQAAKGWMIEKVGAYFWTYRKIQPKKVRFSVVYVAEGSEYNPTPTRGEELLRELSEDAGWTLKATMGQMNVFCSELENPVPMETDPVTQVEAIHRAMKKGGQIGSVTSIVMAVYFAALFGWRIFRNPVDALAQGFWLWLVISEMLIGLSGLINLISWKVWYRKASVAAEEGEYVELWNHRTLSWDLTGLSLCADVMMILSFRELILLFAYSLLGVALLVALVRWISRLMRENQVSKKVNLALSIGLTAVLTLAMLGTITFAVFHFHLDGRNPVDTWEEYGMEMDVYADEIPLRVEDLLITDQKEWSTEKRETASFLVEKRNFRQWPLTTDEAPLLEYEVIDVKAPWLYEICLNGILDVGRQYPALENEGYRPVKPEAWGAEEAYQLFWNQEAMNRYVLCYGNRIVLFRPDWQPVAKTKALVGEILGKSSEK